MLQQSSKLAIKRFLTALINPVSKKAGNESFFSMALSSKWDKLEDLLVLVKYKKIMGHALKQHKKILTGYKVSSRALFK
jgi:hypothetical protein